ncbi:hypothetical protein V8C34DRAFT_294324 [Trichoderma compactum]
MQFMCPPMALLVAICSAYYHVDMSTVPLKLRYFIPISLRNHCPWLPNMPLTLVIYQGIETPRPRARLEPLRGAVNTRITPVSPIKHTVARYPIHIFRIRLRRTSQSQVVTASRIRISNLERQVAICMRCLIR